ncbi:MAG: hypothetical protein R3305_04300, partial [Gammaproteobacteria bacterium]|nr:hypothetical protein [Gammaproteobacteria bacterium]
SDGVLDARDASVKTQIEDIGDERERLADRLIALEERLFRQFNALDGLLAQLQSTSSFLTQQLAAIPRSDTLLRGND